MGHGPPHPPARKVGTGYNTAPRATEGQPVAGPRHRRYHNLRTNHGRPDGGTTHMEPTDYDQLHQILSDQGADAALDRLCATLTKRREYDRLFDALILRARRQFGL